MTLIENMNKLGKQKADLQAGSESHEYAQYTYLDSKHLFR